MPGQIPDLHAAIYSLAMAIEGLREGDVAVALEGLQRICRGLERRLGTSTTLPVARARHDVPQKMLTIREAAELLQIHPKTLQRHVRARKFPCVRVGGRIRFDPSDVARWVSARKEGQCRGS